jgi:hypothetical protein
MFSEKDVASEMECAHLCVARSDQCRSVNVGKKRSHRKLKCQMNNETEENNLKNFVPHPSYNYHEPKYVSIYFILNFLIRTERSYTQSPTNKMN